MAGTTLQNVQRAIILLQVITLSIVGTFLTIKLIKKRIDLRHDKPKPNASEKYKEHQTTEQQVDTAAVKDTILNDDDTCTERLMKKICEVNVHFNPWLTVGASQGFSISFYIIGLVCCLLFNTFKVHRACIDQMISRWAIQSCFPICCILLLLNIELTTPSVMLYTLV